MTRFISYKKVKEYLNEMKNKKNLGCNNKEIFFCDWVYYYKFNY